MLRSAKKLFLSQPPNRLKSCCHAFSFGAPGIWNNIPQSMKTAKSVDNFKVKLNTYFIVPHLNNVLIMIYTDWFCTLGSHGMNKFAHYKSTLSLLPNLGELIRWDLEQFSNYYHMNRLTQWEKKFVYVYLMYMLSAVCRWPRLFSGGLKWENGPWI